MNLKRFFLSVAVVASALLAPQAAYAETTAVVTGAEVMAQLQGVLKGTITEQGQLVEVLGAQGAATVWAAAQKIQARRAVPKTDKLYAEIEELAQKNGASAETVLANLPAFAKSGSFSDRNAVNRLFAGAAPVAKEGANAAQATAEQNVANSQDSRYAAAYCTHNGFAAANVKAYQADLCKKVQGGELAAVHEAATAGRVLETVANRLDRCKGDDTFCNKDATIGGWDDSVGGWTQKGYARFGNERFMGQVADGFEAGVNTAFLKGVVNATSASQVTPQLDVCFRTGHSN